MNKFYVYCVGKKFVKTNGLDLSLTKNINNSSYWINKRKANTWKGLILRKYPDVKINTAFLTIKCDLS